MAPGLWDKFKSKIRKKRGGSDSQDDPASKRPSTAQSTTPDHATSSSVATPTSKASTTTTPVTAQAQATTTAQSAVSLTGQLPASSAAPSANPQSTQSTASPTAQPTTSSTTQPATFPTTQPAASGTVRPTIPQSPQSSSSSTAQSLAPPTPQPVACSPTQSTASPPPPTTATPSAPQSLPEQLWKKAYANLNDKEPARVQAYEEILSKFKKEWVGTGASPTVPDLEHCKSAEAADMWKLVYAGLEKCKKQAEFKEAVADVLGTVDKIKGIVDKAVKYSPEASTIWAGASLGLEILANPVTEPGINRKGVAYVLSRMEWYWNLADVVLSKDIASSSTADLRGNLESHVVDLYQKLLLFQMRSVCLYDRNGISVVLRDSVKLDDWTDKIKEVKDAETLVQKDVDEFTEQDMREREEDKYDQECLVDLLLTDPQKDKERIQTIRGSPLWSSYHWILEHPGYGKFTNDASSRVLWIKGDPGKGKTMLICGIIDQLDRSTDPLSYFFCQATEKDQSGDTAVMRGLIYMILDHYPSLMSKLRVEYDKKKKKLFEGPNTSLLLDKVLTEMLQDPILKDAIFIIDALDECKTGRSNLVKLIVKLSSSCRAKWIVSSRDWPEIKEEFRGIQGLVPITLEDEENKKKVTQAVQSYIRTKVDDLAQNWGDDKNNSKGKKKDLKETVYDYMVSHAEDTFLWVALVCQRLAESDVPRRRVEEELRKFPKGLPDLYKLMMDRILTSSESDRLKAVLAASCLAYGHLKSNDMIDFVDLMAGYDEMDVMDTIGSCGSFLTYQDGAVYFVHQSAKEYLLNEGSGHIFPHGVEHQHLQMTRRCLETLQSGLKENIYGLSSYGTLIGEFTRPNPDPLSPLEYSCLHWARHLVESAACRKDVTIVDQVMHFLRDKFTYWLEALSLLGQLPVAAKATVDIESVLGPVEAKDFLEFLQDARRFVRYHKAAIEIAPRQVYASALVFSPRCSKVRERFQKQTPKWIVSGPDMQDDWDPCIQTISAGSSYGSVLSVACSPDGHLFAAACGNEAKVYDATSGECVYTLRFTPYMRVYCVTFSPCGRKLAAATKIQARILQVDTFDCIQTLTDGGIRSVLFSPDGEQLATVTSAGVRVWNWKTRVKVNDLSHRLVSPSATFLSKDKLVIGSAGRAAKVWNLATHSCEQTLEDHGLPIASSPDGKRLATGSADGAVKVWHQAADTKKWICSQTLHHITGVMVVCFSADGRILITGSFDSCIRLWNEAGACIKIMNSHGIGIGDLSVFPTGQKLLACNFMNEKIMLWDISTSSAESPREARLPSPEEVSTGLADDDTDWIISLIFSPDGKTLLSHTEGDKTKVWSVGTGSCVSARETSDFHPAFFEKPATASAWLAYPNSVERAAIRDRTGETVVWDLVENKRLGLPGEMTPGFLSTERFGETVVIFSPDSGFYAVSSFVRPPTVFYVPTGECIYTSSSYNTPLAFSPDSRELFTYSGPTLYREKLDNGVFRTLGLGQAGTSTASFCMNTQFGILEAAGHSNSSKDVKLVGWGLSFERDWILRGTERMLFIPTEHRRLIVDAIRKRFAIVCPSGRIVTMEVA
ncbi:hypothetical protein B0J15DRAFT_559062 [Fusarium solani]|uniref:Mitochondrial division protein 1 n=1 Tax=Fusarium solani TaxID=169388 RepID=A0A9P9HBN1_FUSSL|nr:uncharacterized protein B0J15DRAFT_559062 [Fusarium solani]KAH7254734.1 hypothetical protein B0J15DRAFT_559062 [Fusarium solani]